MATAKNGRSDKLKKILKMVGGILVAVLSTFFGINVYQNADDPSTPPSTVTTSNPELEIITDDSDTDDNGTNANDQAITQGDYNLDDVLEVTMLDVGQADCFLLRQGKKTCLIDCGTRSTGKDAVEYLKGLGITKLDYVIGTHPHDDHMGGMYSILTNFKVGKVVLSEETMEVFKTSEISRDPYVLRDIPMGEDSSKFYYDEFNGAEVEAETKIGAEAKAETETKIRAEAKAKAETETEAGTKTEVEVDDNVTRGAGAGWIAQLTAELADPKYYKDFPSVGTTYNLGKAKMKVVGPIDVSNEKDYNNLSLVIKVSFGDMDILFTGDAGTSIEKQILETGEDISAEVLKVGHHGSDTSSSKEFVEAVNPKYALISAECGNRYEHPMEPILKLLKKKKIPVYRTDEHSKEKEGSGTVVMVLTEDSISFNKKKGSYLTGPDVEKKYGGK